MTNTNNEITNAQTSTNTNNEITITDEKIEDIRQRARVYCDNVLERACTDALSGCGVSRIAVAIYSGAARGLSGRKIASIVAAVETLAGQRHGPDDGKDE